MNHLVYLFSLIGLIILSPFISYAEEIQEYKKVVILDAGSSGSRAMAYRFSKPYNYSFFDLSDQSPLIEGSPLQTETPLDEKIISFVASHIEKLSTIQSNQLFLLGATAGMRALNQTQAKLILQQKEQELHALGVNAQYNKNIRLLSGLDEGAFTWFGINFIMRENPSDCCLNTRIHRISEDHANQYGIIEMGGGSVQIAFSLPSNNTLISSGDDINSGIKHLYLGESYELNIFSHSYSDMGINSALSKIKKAGSKTPPDNACINTDPASPRDSYRNCQSAIEKVMFPSAQPPQDTDDYSDYRPEKFVITGYYYDYLVAMGLPDTLNLSQLDRAAEHICTLSYGQLMARSASRTLFDGLFDHDIGHPSTQYNATEDFLSSGSPRKMDINDYCTHLTYMTLYLTKVGLSVDHQLIIKKSLPYKSRRYGVSWPLGYAILSANNWS